MIPFGITAPGRILFGRGEAAKAPALIRAFGSRVLVVHGANAARAAWLRISDAEVQALPCASEPTLTMLETSLRWTRGLGPQVVVGLGGGAVMDFAKALAALIPASGGPMDHLEVVGKGLPLKADPLPFIAVPTTAGTGAEVTKNAVIGLPDLGRKVSLRDDRMVARLAIVDPALTDYCPKAVTLASGLDAVTQVIEPFVSLKATPYTDALAGPAIGTGLEALMRLMQHAFDGTLPFQPAAERIAGKAGEAHLGQMLQKGIEQGELNPELDLTLAAYVINQVMGDLGSFLVRRLGLSLEAVADDIAQLDQPAVNAVFDSLVMLLRHGLAPQRNEQ